MIDSVVAKDYKIGKKLGSGAFGEVFQAFHVKNYTQVAVKLQSRNNKSPQLFYQAKILSTLSSDDNSVVQSFQMLGEQTADRSNLSKIKNIKVVETNLDNFKLMMKKKSSNSMMPAILQLNQSGPISLRSLETE